MRYLTISEIKQQSIIDKSFKDDDELLCALATAAEDALEQEMDISLDELAEANDGELPNPIRQAALMLADYLYSVERGGSGTGAEVPEVVYRLCRLYRKYN